MGNVAPIPLLPLSATHLLRANQQTKPHASKPKPKPNLLSTSAYDYSSLFSQMVPIKCLFFAKSAELAKTEHLVIELDDAQTDINHLLQRLFQRVPALSALNGSTMVAVNMEYLDAIKEDGSIDSDRVLQAGDEVALIPPVSGG